MSSCTYGILDIEVKSKRDVSVLGICLQVAFPWPCMCAKLYICEVELIESSSLRLVLKHGVFEAQRKCAKCSAPLFFELCQPLFVWSKDVFDDPRSKRWRTGSCRCCSGVNSYTASFRGCGLMVRAAFSRASKKASLANVSTS